MSFVKNIEKKREKFKESVADVGVVSTLSGRVGGVIKRFFRRIYRTLVVSFYKGRAVNGRVLHHVKGNQSAMLLNVADRGISRELLSTGFHEKNSTTFIRTQLKEGMRVLEIGANIGYYSLLEASIVGPTGYIYAFEPDPVNMASLKVNMLLNGHENVSYFDKAVGNENKKDYFYMSNYGNLGSMIQRKDDMCNYKKIEVDVVRLDDFFDVDTIDYFRMDVEGFELEIIKSMSKILSAGNAPKGMFVEVHSDLLHEINSSAWDFVKYLKESYGYDIVKAFHRGGSRHVVNTTADFENHPLREKGYWEVFFSRV